MEKRRWTSVDRTPSIGPRTPLIVHHQNYQASASSAVDSAVSDDSLSSNPLLHDFDFPPFDSVDAKHVLPGICALLQQLESELEELEKSVEPSWLKLVEPLEKLVDRLIVV
uniref:Putative cytosolic oligopeptidase A n=1 Tax=Noccaea caerulescens TaxID=107243 RepID=A0A1J3IAM8_NOCCA